MENTSNTKAWYVIKATTLNRRKVRCGEVLSLTESQARPLRSGGFVTDDKAAAERIHALQAENEMLKSTKDKAAAAESADEEGKTL